MVTAGLYLAGVVACGPASETSDRTFTNVSGSSPLVASDFNFGNVRSLDEYLQEARYAEADLKNGELLGNSCLACHTFGLGEKHSVGPNIYGFFLQRAARHTDFEYSDALRESGIVWTPAALEAWLALPSRFLPNTIMPFAGFKSEADRRDLVAFLMTKTN